MIYLYDNSMDGLLTCIFTLYERKQFDAEILAEKDYTNLTFLELERIQTDREKAKRVLAGCERKISSNFVKELYQLYLSDIPESGRIIRDYVKDGLTYGRYIYQYLHLPSVLEASRLLQKVRTEVHRLYGLVRFRKIDHVYVSDISPDHNVLPLLLSHFHSRLPLQDWVIRDTRRRLALLHLNGNVDFLPYEGADLPSVILDEFEDAWREFYHSIAIPERKNESLRRNYMPTRYWKNLTEFYQ